MSLYDDFDAFKQKSDQVAGWSSGIKLFQSQMQLKKANQTQVNLNIMCIFTVYTVMYYNLCFTS